MGRNIVICSDGTGSTFDGRATNVTHLVRCIALDDAGRQVAVYDQGVGTTAARTSVVDDFRATLADPGALRVLAAPPAARLSPRSWVDRGRGLLTGYGLKDNVGQMYRELAHLYAGPDDAVLLFGFSRGAFTVRALAGLLHRCGLPPADAAGSADGREIAERFERAWALYQPIQPSPPDRAAIAQFRATQRDAPVHLLGLWDTVKSYGGLDPVLLPHLRHNPDVAHVRHALALDEHRAWFQPTTWGRLDSDRHGAMTRLDPAELAGCERQDVDEVWFSGAHADIGGGEDEVVTARIALRWMLGEAAALEPGLRLSGDGQALLAAPDPPTRPEVHESSSRAWRLVERLPRKEIDNSGPYPVKRPARGSTGRRVPERYLRDGSVALHATAVAGYAGPGPVVVRRTRGG